MGIHFTLHAAVGLGYILHFLFRSSLTFTGVKKSASFAGSCKFYPFGQAARITEEASLPEPQKFVRILAQTP